MSGLCAVLVGVRGGCRWGANAMQEGDDAMCLCCNKLAYYAKLAHSQDVICPAERGGAGELVTKHLILVSEGRRLASAGLSFRRRIGVPQSGQSA